MIDLGYGGDEVANVLENRPRPGIASAHADLKGTVLLDDSESRLLAEVLSFSNVSNFEHKATLSCGPGHRLFQLSTIIFKNVV